MESRTVLNLRMRWTRCIKHYGRDDPRTVEAARELAEARADAAQAEADRLRALADSMAVAS